MSERFEIECADRATAAPLVTEACCREKTAYFILGAGNKTVGYVAAEVAANRRAKRLNDSVASDIGEEQVDDDIPTLIQIYVEHEFRRLGYATEALKLLLRDHQALRVADPSQEVLRMVEQLGFARAGTQEGPDGRSLTSFVRTSMFEDARISTPF
jgi:RimJ/RimL family protein N-acetyltransferase